MSFKYLNFLSFPQQLSEMWLCDQVFKMCTLSYSWQDNCFNVICYWPWNALTKLTVTLSCPSCCSTNIASADILPYTLDASSALFNTICTFFPISREAFNEYEEHTVIYLGCLWVLNIQKANGVVECIGKEGAGGLLPTFIPSQGMLVVGLGMKTFLWHWCCIMPGP